MIILRKKINGLIMSRMGSDGAMGCREIVSPGGYTITHDEVTPVIYGMARVSAARNGISIFFPVDKISGHLKELVSY
ncbi:MAG TPA: chemotaxis protein CheB [Spirochaetota bacterium]|nr:chemotaxis protein CheB [Spirochaetota bacterium]HPL19084.1 chemotaxis protein CheB [Spirochaetota bacterium]HQH96375.1 chemotaxis protein CheB [Spirochaetota bacterium]